MTRLGYDFMIKQIAENLFELSSDTSELCSQAYLLTDGERRLLIDSGDGSIEFDFIPDICVLTHNHTDHTKGVQSDWKTVFMHPSDINSQNQYSHVPKQTKPIDELFVHIPHSGTSSHNSILQFGSFELQLLHTPGHTAGSISLYDRNRKILFSGDTWFGNGWYGRTDIGGSMQDLKKSLSQLNSLDIKLLCPGHHVF